MCVNIMCIILRTFWVILNIGISGKTDQNNIVQITIQGRNHSTEESINNSIVWVHKSQPIWYGIDRT